MRSELKQIERDKNGFATEKCKAEMYEALPIIVFANEKYWNNHFEYVEKSNWQDFIADIELDTKYIYYFKCPKIEQIED